LWLQQTRVYCGKKRPYPVSGIDVVNHRRKSWYHFDGVLSNRFLLHLLLRSSRPHPGDSFLQQLVYNSIHALPSSRCVIRAIADLYCWGIRPWLLQIGNFKRLTRSRSKGFRWNRVEVGVWIQ
jgi:hypothetical protein